MFPKRSQTIHKKNLTEFSKPVEGSELAYQPIEVEHINEKNNKKIENIIGHTWR